jgi:hypothetical protein
VVVVVVVVVEVLVVVAVASLRFGYAEQYSTEQYRTAQHGVLSFNRIDLISRNGMGISIHTSTHTRTESV